MYFPRQISRWSSPDHSRDTYVYISAMHVSKERNPLKTERFVSDIRVWHGGGAGGRGLTPDCASLDHSFAYFGWRPCFIFFLRLQESDEKRGDAAGLKSKK